MVSRMGMRSRLSAATLTGHLPRLVSLTGKLVISRPNVQPLQGAEIEAIDSASGWAAVSDEKGYFTIRFVNWYPGVRYNLIIQPNAYQARQVQIKDTRGNQKEGVIDLGDLSFDESCPVDLAAVPGRQSISHIKYDSKNIAYYRSLFHSLTRDKQSVPERLEAVNQYVAGRLITAAGGHRDEDPVHRESESPQEVLEKGTRYCGKMALALATLAESAGYTARLIDLLSSDHIPDAHAVTEIYYEGRWHLYDPTQGLSYPDNLGRVSSYKELRLNPGLITVGHLPLHLPSTRNHHRDKRAAQFYSGSVHYYRLDR
jgi:hypothetical protein